MQKRRGAGWTVLLAVTLSASADNQFWKAWEAAEEAWIRDRHELLIREAPAALNAAALDLEVRLVDLRRRSYEFRRVAGRDRAFPRSGMGALSEFSISPVERAEMMDTLPGYRKEDERLRQLDSALRRHPQYSMLLRAQLHVMKTPQYREIHRRHAGRMQDLYRLYGSVAEIRED